MTYRTKILSTGSAFPAKRLSNYDLAKMVETDHDWIVERTGIHARRISDLSPAETCSGLAATASRLALERAGLTANDLDCILFATITPDFIMPSTACVLQQKLGARRAAALDISAACSGFVYGASIADAFIKIGQYRHVLLIGAEVLSPIVNWKDRGTCILFGDGAGAAILSRAQDGEKSQLYSHHLYADGWCGDYLTQVAGGTARPISQQMIDANEQFVTMKGREIYKVAVRMLADCAVEALEKNGYTINDLDWLVPHQANLRIIEAVAKRLGLPMSKVILNIEEFGNTSSATVPTAFDEAVTKGTIKRGDLVLLDVFGAGLTYGSTLLRY